MIISIFVALMLLLTFPALADHAENPEHQSDLKHAHEICKEFGFNIAISSTDTSKYVDTGTAKCVQEEYRYMQEEKLLQGLLSFPDLDIKRGEYLEWPKPEIKP